jgi:hypothetical protein
MPSASSASTIVSCVARNCVKMMAFSPLSDATTAHQRAHLGRIVRGGLRALGEAAHAFGIQSVGVRAQLLKRAHGRRPR